MARARVSQNEAISYQIGGRVYKRGESQIITNASEIARLKAISGFSVFMLAEQPPKQKAVAPSSEPEAELESDDESEQPETEAKTAKRGLRRRGRK